MVRALSLRSHAACVFRRWSGITLRRIARWHRLAYERRLLATLDDRMLRDIGVTKSEAQAESRKPFWRER